MPWGSEHSGDDRRKTLRTCERFNVRAASKLAVTAKDALVVQRQKQRCVATRCTQLRVRRKAREGVHPRRVKRCRGVLEHSDDDRRKTQSAWELHLNVRAACELLVAAEDELVTCHLAAQLSFENARHTWGSVANRMKVFTHDESKDAVGCLSTAMTTAGKQRAQASRVSSSGWLASWW